jgi:replicative DNA helicase
LDEALGGGLYAGKLYATAAKRKHAKTVTAGTIAANIAASGTPTLFFALEMGEEGIAQRIIARHLKTNSLAFLARDNPRLRDDVLRFADSYDTPLFFEDRPGLGFAELKNLASEYVARHGVKVIVVDYWQLVGGRSARQSLVEHLDHVAQWLADFAKSSGCAVWCPAQLNRDGDTRSGEGLRLACDMYLVQSKVTQPDGKTEGIWFDMQDSRYTPTTEIGSEECCPFYISRTGPHLAAFSD